MSQQLYQGCGRFIWLDPARYPAFQETAVRKADDGLYCVAEFQHTISPAGPVKQIVLDVTGAAQYFLWCGERFVGAGPASAGGDFLVEKPLPWQYVDRYTLTPDTGDAAIKLYAKVRLKSEQLTEFTP